MAGRISADTDRLRRDSFGAYVHFTTNNHDTFVDVCEENGNVLPYSRVSDVDEAVQQLPTTARTAEILRIIYELPTLDQDKLLLAARTFEAVEDENERAANFADPSGANTRH
ncbi:hypothetical protein ACIA8K_25760 [Catenuloplanes sp. NPDC051500]|uniref:hypothetical protein n=1 Tax=Catenuloplanes sp. NPDC051500 TaxID=3363959 RepID=UPI0037A5CF71